MSNEVTRTMKDVLAEDSYNYAARRKFFYKKKLTPESLRKEIAVARILGEMSATERIISELVLKPEWTREDLEAALHMFVVECGDAASEIMGTHNNIDIDTVLEAHGYYKKAKAKQEENDANNTL